MVHYSLPVVLTKAIALISSRKTFPLHDLYVGSETEPLVITPAEKSYLLSELKKLREFKWPAVLKIILTRPGSRKKTQ